MVMVDVVPWFTSIGVRSSGWNKKMTKKESHITKSLSVIITISERLYAKNRTTNCTGHIYLCNQSMTSVFLPFWLQVLSFGLQVLFFGCSGWSKLFHYRSMYVYDKRQRYHLLQHHSIIFWTPTEYDEWLQMTLTKQNFVVAL